MEVTVHVVAALMTSQIVLLCLGIVIGFVLATFTKDEAKQ